MQASQPAGRLLAELIFDQLADQLLAQRLGLLVPRQQHRGFDLHQPRRHFQKFGRHIQVRLLHPPDGLHILVEHLVDGDVQNVQFVFLHQKEKQVERPLEIRQLIGNGLHAYTS